MTRLKPCPFCAADKPEVLPTATGYLILCRERCGCQMTVHTTTYVKYLLAGINAVKRPKSKNRPNPKRRAKKKEQALIDLKVDVSDKPSVTRIGIIHHKDNPPLSILEQRLVEIRGATLSPTCQQLSADLEGRNVTVIASSPAKLPLVGPAPKLTPPDWIQQTVKEAFRRADAGCL